MSYVFKSMIFAVGILCLSGFAPASSAEPPAVPTALIREHVSVLRDIFSARVITMSVEAQNDRRQGMTEEQIVDLDNTWREETKAEDQPLIAATLISPASTLLTQVQARSGGLYNALFVMDRYGLNVGQSVPTSDYWQGDEEKFQKTYQVGPDAVFIDAPEYDDGLKTWIVQVSMTLVHDGQSIGSATVDIIIQELQRRAAAGL